MGVTEKLATFVAHTRFEDIPPQAVKIVGRQILDTLGVILLASKEPKAQTIIQYVKSLGGFPQARIIVDGYSTTSPNAALANGTLAHSIDYDDVGGFDHSSCVLVSTILALGEEHKISGKKVIEAYVMGYETGTRLLKAYDVISGPSRTISFHDKGFHSMGEMGSLGSAAAAAKILGLGVMETCVAFGLAAMQSSGTFHNLGTMAKPFLAGHTARGGITAAQLAKMGLSAAPDIVEADMGLLKAFSGGQDYDADIVVKDLGNPFVMTSPGPGIKLYPACAGTHRAIDAVLYLVNKHDIHPQDVESIEAEDLTGCLLWPSKVGYIPKTGLEAKFSIPYTMAVALLHRKVVQAHFDDRKIASPEIKEVIKKIKANPQLTSPGETKQVRIKMKNGEEYSHAVDYYHGHPLNPASDEEVIAKFRDCAQGVIPAQNIERCLELCQKLESVEDITQLVDTVIAKTASNQ